MPLWWDPAPGHLATVVGLVGPVLVASGSELHSEEVELPRSGSLIGTLQSERLVMKAATVDTLPELAAHWNEPEVRRHLFDGGAVTLEQASSLLEMLTRSDVPGTGLWACRLRDSGELIGSAGLFQSTIGAELEPRLEGLIEPVLSVKTELHGGGLGTEILSSLLRHAFDDHGLTQLAATVDEPNLRSIAMVERAGFKRLSRVMGPAHPLVTFLLEVGS